MITEELKQRLHEHRNALNARFEELNRSTMPFGEKLEAYIELRNQYDEFEDELLTIARQNGLSVF